MPTQSLFFGVAQAFKLATAYTATVTDSRGSGMSIALNTAGAWYRQILAKRSGGAGTNPNPYELLTTINSALNTSYWELTLTDNGFWVGAALQYKGTGTGSITFPATIANILGFKTTAISLASGAYYSGERHPSHIIECVNFSGDTGYRNRSAPIAAEMMPDGSVYGFQGAQPGALRTFGFELMPKDFDTVYAAYLGGHQIPGHVAYASSARFTSAGTDPGQDGYWSAQDFLNTALGKSLGICFGNLQDIVSGVSGASFDVCYLPPETLKGAQLSLSRQGWDARRDLKGLEVSLFAKGVVY